MATYFITSLQKFIQCYDSVVIEIEFPEQALGLIVVAYTSSKSGTGTGAPSILAALPELGVSFGASVAGVNRSANAANAKWLADLVVCICSSLRLLLLDLARAF